MKQTLYWHELCHWGDEQDGKDANTFVLLGMRDRLVDPDTMQWLEDEHPEITVATHDFSHGGCCLPWSFTRGATATETADVIHKFLKS